MVPIESEDNSNNQTYELDNVDPSIQNTITNKYEQIWHG